MTVRAARCLLGRHSKEFQFPATSRQKESSLTARCPAIVRKLEDSTWTDLLPNPTGIPASSSCFSEDMILLDQGTCLGTQGRGEGHFHSPSALQVLSNVETDSEIMTRGSFLLLFSAARAHSNKLAFVLSHKTLTCCSAALGVAGKGWGLLPGAHT